MDVLALGAAELALQHGNRLVTGDVQAVVLKEFGVLLDAGQAHAAFTARQPTTTR
ncbi:hypothetical protein GCM10023347_19450 [Streptomyces chumphonensis]|uniref:hypothetical protein n=1 Tax=Streptomyces chumphonensis TaxID=1214925 RepID=UPI0031ED4E5B